jgi:hypothetical protein
MEPEFTFVEETNASRAKRAQDLVSRYSAAYRSEDDQMALSDLLADMMHLTFRRSDMDFDDAMRMAEIHFMEELEEELTPEDWANLTTPP